MKCPTSIIIIINIIKAIVIFFTGKKMIKYLYVCLFFQNSYI